MADRFANRVAEVTQSDIRRMSARCAELGGVNLSQGVCDQPAPEPVKLAAKQAINDDRAIYTHLAGMKKLRASIAEKIDSFNKMQVDPDTQVAVTVGSAGGFFCAALALLEPGDEVILFSPFYNYYVDAVKLLGANIRFVDTQPPDWRYSSEQLRDAFSERTRMIVVNTPCNPTGKVFSLEELEEVAELAEKWDAWIIADEVYEYITFDVPHVSIGRLEQARQRTITLNSASKTYAVTGWRIGYAVGPPEAISRIGYIGDQIYICAPSPLQYGVEAGLRQPRTYYAEMALEYRHKRDMLVETLRAIGWEPYVPCGAFYVMADFGQRYADGVEAADRMLEEAGVAAVPARSFYRDADHGRSQLRFCFAKQTDSLEEGCRRLRAWAG